MSNGESKVAVLGAINLVFAGLNFLWILLIVLALVYGIFFSGDSQEDVVAGTMGSVLFLLPAILGFAVYLLAGIGLMKHRPMGFYMNIVGAVIAAFSCVGVIWTIVALIFGLQSDFKAACFPPSAPPA